MGKSSHSEEVQMSFGEHLEELRRRLWLCVIGVGAAMVVCFIFGERLVNFLKAPIVDALVAAGAEDTHLVAINVVDPFMIYMKVAFFAALFVSSPWILWQLWQFVASGLYPHERKYVRIFAPVTAVLFLAGCAFAYTVLVKYGIRFLIAFGMGMDIRPILSINDNLMLVLVLSLVMGLVFQLPLVMLILTRIGIVESATFTRRRRVFILAAFVLGAIITPTGDPVNLLLATVPILVLYEIGIWISKLAEHRRTTNLAG